MTATKLETIYGIIRAGVIDGIAAQVPIQGENVQRVDDGSLRFAQWAHGQQGTVVMIDAGLDVEEIAMDISVALMAVLDRVPEPERGVLCRHCGAIIERGQGGIWRHTATGYRSCDPADPEPTKAEP